MDLLRTLNINYPALSEGVCATLHPFLEEYEVELASEAKSAEPVVICVDGDGW